MPKVHVVGNDYSVNSMFLRMGWTVVNYIDEAVSLIQFTGGEDVDPSYYNETKHPRTFSNPKRDAREAAIYHEWKKKIPMAGICRGGQFLNVMNGGSMWQHVNNHATGMLHDAYCHVTETVYSVTSTHHQMMRPSIDAKVLLTASLSTTKETADITLEGLENDIEAVLYKKTKCLCYQPHPEYVSINHECQQLYFNYLEKYLL